VSGHAEQPEAGQVDPSAFRERTMLAWMRTALAFAGCALLVARLVQVRQPAAAPAAAVLGIAIAVGLAGGASARYRTADRHAGTLLAGLVCATAAASLALAAGSLVLAVLPR